MFRVASFYIVSSMCVYIYVFIYTYTHLRYWYM